MTALEKQVMKWDGYTDLDIRLMEIMDEHPERERLILKLILDQNPHKKEIARMCSRKTETGWKVKAKRVRLVRMRKRHGA